MIKKTIHHLSKGTLRLLEIVGFVAIIAVLAWLGLLWRLSQGPLNVDFLTGHLVNALGGGESGFTYSIDETQLTWSGRFEPVEIRLNKVLITRADKTPVLSVDRINVRLSRRRILFGSIVPREIEIHGPSLRIIRWEDRHLTLNLGAPEPARVGPEPAPDTAPTDNAGLIRELLARMRDRSIPFIGGLGRVSIVDASVFYDDRVLNTSWNSRRSSISFEREQKGIRAETTLALGLDEQNTATLRTRAFHDWDTGETDVIAAFSNFTPALAAQGSPQLQALTDVDLPLKGSLAFKLDSSFTPRHLRFILGSDEGTVSGLGLYKTPVPVKKLYVEGHLNLQTFKGAVERLSLDLGGPRIEATAAATPKGAATLVTLNGAVHDVPFDNLATWWPESAAPAAREWVTERLSKGTAQKATIELGLLVGPGPAHAVAVEKMGGRIDFTGVTTDYFPPLPPVTGVDGMATYDATTFTLALNGGTLKDMKVGKSDIRITHLDAGEDEYPWIEIETPLEGPLKTALKALESKPLEYPQILGVKTDTVRGGVKADLTFKFPLSKDLRLDEMKVGVKATLNDIFLDEMAAGLPLAGGPMNLTVSNTEMTLDGKGVAGTMPATFTWHRNFPDDAKIRQEIKAQVTLDVPGMAHFGVPAEMNVAGTMPASVSYTVGTDKKGILTLKGDVAQASFDLPYIDVTKPLGTAGQLNLTLHTDDGELRRISDLSLDAGDMRVRGDMTFDEKSGLRTATLPTLKAGRTDATLAVSRDAAGKYTIGITGSQFDAASFIKDDAAPGTAEERNAAAAVQVPPLAVTLDVARLLTGPESFAEGVKMSLSRNAWGRIDKLELAGTAKGPFSVRYLPSGGGHSLAVQAENAGAMLGAFGITKGIKGGTLSISAVPTQNGGPRDLSGTAVMRNFTLIDVPILARLLNAMSLTGIIDLLNGKGVAFTKAKTEFFWVDRGPPGDKGNARALQLKDGETAGASLGLTFEGYVDEWKKTYDLNGTIIPVSDMNKMVASIPLVGNILTGGGGAVFAATYAIKGPKSDPTVTVNPVSVLAPGILRKLFFE